MNPQVNAAIKKISKIGTDLSNNLAVLEKYTYEKLDKVVSEIDAKEEMLSTLNLKYKEEERREKVDLELRTRLHEVGTMESLAKKHNIQLVTKEEYTSLLSKVKDAEKNTHAAVGAAVSAAKTSLNAENKAKNSTSAIELATLEAELNQSKIQIDFLNREVTRVTTELAKSGERMVKIAEASTQASVNINK